MQNDLEIREGLIQNDIVKADRSKKNLKLLKVKLHLFIFSS